MLFAALFMAILVYFFTKNIPHTYESKAKVYTGLGSGQSLDPNKPAFMDIYSLNNAFDNLITIIKSRETLEEVSLRLLAKHLLLEKADPKFISEKNYKELMELVPSDVKALAVRKLINNKTSDKLNDTSANENLKVEKTPEKITTKNDITHIVQYDETLYSISKKYNIAISEIQKLNNLIDFNIRPGQKLIISKSYKTENIEDTPTTSEDQNNIYYFVNENETLELVSQKFNISVKDLIMWNSLHERQLKTGQKLIIGKKNDKIDNDNGKTEVQPKTANKNNEEVIGQSALEKRLDKDFDNSPELEQTLRNLYEYKSRNDTNFIYGLLNYNYKHYSLAALGEIMVERVQTSDLIEISYESDDPAICQQTLIILCKILIKNFKQIKANQSDEVVNYFTKQVENARERLQKAEDELLQFNKENNIINYDEQTKNIAAKKEDLESAYQDERMNMVSAQAAIQKLEAKIANQGQINLKNSEIISKRNELAEVTSRITYLETETERNSQQEQELKTLKSRSEKLKAELQKAIDEWFNLTNTSEGMPAKDMLNQWLDNVIRYEESKAKVDVYTSRIANFSKNYETFAPLGAQLKRIEREISVSEQEYLSLLNSLNEGKLKQQNIELTSNVKVIDYPYYPLSPKVIKRKFLVAMAFLFGFFVIFILLIFFDYFDQSIKNQERIKEKSKLEVAGVFPHIPKRNRRINYELIKDRMADLIIQDINLTKTAVGNKYPNITGIISNGEGEGKTFLLKIIGEKMLSYGLDVHCLSHSDSITLNQNHFSLYQPDLKYNTAKNISEFNPNTNHEYILIEIPALLTHNFPSDLIKTFSNAYYVCNAKRKFSNADTNSLEALSKLMFSKPKIILNNTATEAVESVFGEVPRKRSKLRLFFKNSLYRRK